MLECVAVEARVVCEFCFLFFRALFTRKPFTSQSLHRHMIFNRCITCENLKRHSQVRNKKDSRLFWMQKISRRFMWLTLEGKKRLKCISSFSHTHLKISEWERSTKKYTRSTIVVEENEYRIIRNIKVYREGRYTIREQWTLSLLLSHSLLAKK
jgi:hypothetical protein